VLVCLDNKQQWWLLQSAWGRVQCDATVIESTPLRLRVAFKASRRNRYCEFDTVDVNFEGAHAKRLAAFLNEGRVEKPTHGDSHEADAKAAEVFLQMTEMECKREDQRILENLILSWIVAAFLGGVPAITLGEWLTHA